MSDKQFKITTHSVNRTQFTAEINGIPLIGNKGCPSKCKKCGDTGYLFGAQNWNPKWLERHGSPYYTGKCNCENAKEKRKAFKESRK